MTHAVSNLPPLTGYLFQTDSCIPALDPWKRISRLIKSIILPVKKGSRAYPTIVQLKTQDVIWLP